MLPAYLGAFALTLLVEVPVYVVALTAGAGVPAGRAVAVAVGVNVVTHPVLWWSLRACTANPAYPWIFIGAEIAVCVVEGALLARWTRAPRGDRWLLAVASVAANAASMLAGLLIMG